MKYIINGFSAGLMLSAIGVFFFGSDEHHAIFFVGMACYFRIFAQGLKGK